MVYQGVSAGVGAVIQQQIGGERFGVVEEADQKWMRWNVNAFLILGPFLRNGHLCVKGHYFPLKNYRRTDLVLLLCFQGQLGKVCN